MSRIPHYSPPNTRKGISSAFYGSPESPSKGASRQSTYTDLRIDGDSVVLLRVIPTLRERTVFRHYVRVFCVMNISIEISWKTSVKLKLQSVKLKLYYMREFGK